MKKLITLTIGLLILAGCSSDKEWTGFYYPDMNNIGDESSWVIQPGFKNIEACRNWVEDVAGSNENYDYECGSGCRYDESFGMNICETTER